MGVSGAASICLGGCVVALKQERHAQRLSDLHDHMLLFLEAHGRALQARVIDQPTGLACLYEAFDEVTKIIAADDVREQQSSEDRSVLVLEVHHRVKNNLQLISSMMSMHIRASRDPQVEGILRRIQDRVASLATVHSDLYRNSEGGILPVAPLLNEIIDGAEEVARSLGQPLEIKRRIADVGLLPDQAIPLSLLTAEALNSTLRDIGPDSLLPDEMSVTFEVTDVCILRIEIAGQANVEMQGPVSVGEQLQQAYAIQLGAACAEDRQDGLHRLIFTFTPEKLQAVS